jgi:hypothetical protein
VTDRWDRLGELEEYEALCEVRLRHLVEVREPLVLVSQIQRSGGTLLSQLFDGHPECHAHPEEVKIGFPRKHDWPMLDLNRPETWFPMLYEPATVDLERGYARRSRPELDHDTFPFVFPLRLQKRIFDLCVASSTPGTVREILDCYFTSYFNAWLDNHNLYPGPKRVVTGFTPRLVMEPANLDRFFATYPDGTLITIVRDPRAWFASAREHKARYGDLEQAIELWRQSTVSSLAARARYPTRTVVITYEQLISETELTVARIAERIGVTMSPALLEPTFNNRPIRADSSFAVERHGVLPDRVTAYRKRLDSALISRIDDLADELYEAAAEVARNEG